MNVLKKINELEQYWGFHVLAVSGWLYIPALIYMLTFKEPYHYIWLPLCLFLSIPCFISVIGIIILIIEQVISVQTKHIFFQNKIFKTISRIGLVITFIFYIVFLFKSFVP